MAANVFELNVNINTTSQSEAQRALNDVSNGSLPDFIGPDGDLINGDEYQKTIEKMEEEMLKKDKLKAMKKVAGKAAMIHSAKSLAVTGMNWAHSRVSTIYKDQARANKISNITGTANERGTSCGFMRRWIWRWPRGRND